MNEAIQHISQQANTLGQNMAEMETLARNLTGINALYEAQLRSAGKTRAYDSIMDAVSDFDMVNAKLAAILEKMNAE